MKQMWYIYPRVLLKCKLHLVNLLMYMNPPGCGTSANITLIIGFERI